jgi:hypothetical protein
MYLETNLQYLPLPYRLAVERMGNEYGNRTIARCREHCQDYAATYPGMLESEQHAMWTESACAIAKRRYLMPD